MQSRKYQYLEKKYKNNDVAMNTNLNCKYLYEERFIPFLSLVYFFLFGGLLRDFLSPQCLGVLYRQC